MEEAVIEDAILEGRMEVEIKNKKYKLKREIKEK